jgi:D-alanyl-D-alanine carboxypeptidase
MKTIQRVKKFKKSTKLYGITLLFVLVLSAGSLVFNLNNKKLKEVEIGNSELIEEKPETKPQDISENKVNEIVPPTATDQSKPTEEPKSQWPVLLTMTEADSLQVVVNKKHKLPSDYIPILTSVAGGSMRPEAANALEKLLSAASSNSVPMSVLSSYRSYNTQVSTYNRWVQQSGQATADTFSARPGHSEHQTGLAVDLGNGTCDLEICFGSTSAGQWLASNAHTYGFIIRYPSGKQAETGYQYEPWHLRYVGVSVATEIKNSGKTLDQYYNKPAGGY